MVDKNVIHMGHYRRAFLWQTLDVCLVVCYVINVLRVQIGAVNWPVVFQGGVIAAALNNAAMFFLLGALFALALLINLILSVAGGFGPFPVPEESRSLVLYPQLFSQIFNWTLPVLNILVTMRVAARVAQKVGVAVRLHGALVGLVGAVITFTINAYIDLELIGNLDSRSVSFFVLTVTAGWLGGMPLHLEQIKAEALYRASQAIQQATNLQTIVAAIGENLTDPDVSVVALWQMVHRGEPDQPAELLLLASWTNSAAAGLPANLQLAAPRPALSLLAGASKEPLILRADRLPGNERTLWEGLGIRQAFFLPLKGSVEESVDEIQNANLIMIASASKSANFSAGRMRIYRTIDAQVALMQENLRLVRQARQAGVIQERQRLAHEIHDTLAQGFISIVTHMEAAERALNHDWPQVKHHINLARETARENVGQARRLVWALRPKMLEQSSLPEALNRLVAHWSEETAIPALMETKGEIYPLHPNAEIVLLRVSQEALANVRKHARAQEVMMTLSYMENLVLLVIADDGIGFDLAQVEAQREGPQISGAGLPTMRERVNEWGGQLFIESECDGGTTIGVSLPRQKNLGFITQVNTGNGVQRQPGTEVVP
jgi:signal transduction histidine kinase